MDLQAAFVFVDAQLVGDLEVEVRGDRDVGDGRGGAHSGVIQIGDQRGPRYRAGEVGQHDGGEAGEIADQNLRQELDLHVGDAVEIDDPCVVARSDQVVVGRVGVAALRTALWHDAVVHGGRE